MLKIIGVFLFALFTFLFSFDLYAQANLLGPKRYVVTSFSGSKVYQEPITRAPDQPMYPYRLIIKNADGQPHALQNCGGRPLLARLLCEIENAANRLYIRIFRVSAARIRINEAQLTTEAHFHEGVAVLERQIGLLESNVLHIELQGNILSSVEITLQSMNVQQPDQTPPILAASIESGIVTNIPSFQISITDESEVATEIYNNDFFVGTWPVKQFTVGLLEGINNFVFKARDQHGNQAPDFLVSVTLDTVPPEITLDSPTSFTVTSLPATFDFRFLTNELLSVFSIEGVQIPAEPDADRVHLAPVEFSSAENAQVEVTAVDLAGNTVTQSFPVELIVDNSAPNIVLGEFPAYIDSDWVGIPVTVSDQSAVSTHIHVNSEYFATVHENNFTYWFEILEDGPTYISFTAEDSVGNSHTQHVTVVRDTSPLSLSIQSPLAEGVYTSLSVPVQFSTNRALLEATVNGNPVAIGPEGNSVTYLWESAFDGAFTLNIWVKDVFGNEITEAVSGTIQLGGNALWTYTECPVE